MTTQAYLLAELVVPIIRRCRLFAGLVTPSFLQQMKGFIFLGLVVALLLVGGRASVKF